MTIVNLTPHELRFVLASGETLTIPTSGTVARVASTDKIVSEVNGIPVLKTEFGEVVDLPEAVPGTVYVVSRLVKSAAADRDDVLVPGRQIRDAEGRVVGCEGLSR